MADLEPDVLRRLKRAPANDPLCANTGGDRDVPAPFELGAGLGFYDDDETAHEDRAWR